LDKNVPVEKGDLSLVFTSSVMLVKYSFSESDSTSGGGNRGDSSDGENFLLFVSVPVPSIFQLSSGDGNFLSRLPIRAILNKNGSVPDICGSGKSSPGREIFNTMNIGGTSDQDSFDPWVKCSLLSWTV